MNDGFLILLIVFIVMSGINEIDKRHIHHEIEIAKIQAGCKP